MDIPGDFVDFPQYFNHSYLDYLNKLPEYCGLLPIFDDVHPVGKNNGEVYLSKYFEEQMVRNPTVGQDKKTSMCQCAVCATYMSKNSQTRFFAPEDNANNNENENNDNSKDLVNTQNLPVLVLPVVPPIVTQQLSTAAVFVPPIPLAEMVYGAWMPRPHDCCYMVGNYHCATYALYLRRKISGVQVLGKPPHEMTCPVRRHLQR